MSASTPVSKPQRGDELDLTIDTLAYGGAGVARLEGYVVFVSGGVP
ncbi:MAG: TRAM domain-containing protein, partial [Solirubrobacterales bacterium]